jgi:hypothetical protein
MRPDRTLYTRQRVLVIGSDPSVVLPPMDAYDVSICANAAPRILADAQRLLDTQIVTGYMTSLDYRSPEHVDAITGLHIPSVWVLESFQGIASTQREYVRRGITWDAMHRIEQQDWADIVQDVCGLPLGRHVVDGSDCEQSVSTGLFCACFAFYAGADAVTLCGVSWEKRPHLTGDLAALQQLTKRGLLCV